jgi:hypothetical protein
MVRPRRFERLAFRHYVWTFYLDPVLPPRIELGYQASEARILSVELREHTIDKIQKELGAGDYRYLMAEHIPKKTILASLSA